MTGCIDQISTSEADTIALAEELARELRGGDIVTLEGDLGSGKTCFVRGLARGLGIDPADVSSPTFIICQEYRGRGAATIAHVDAYRLNSADDLESIGWDELLETPNVIVVLEWPSRIADALTHRPVIRVRIEHLTATTRRITIERPPMDHNTDDTGRRSGHG